MIGLDAHMRTLGIYGSVEELKFTDSVHAIQQKHDQLSTDRQEQLYGEYQQENMLLDNFIALADLGKYYSELLSQIK